MPSSPRGIPASNILIDAVLKGQAPLKLENEGGARTLFLMIEVAHRELDARLLLARRALENGYRVVIGQQWLMNEHLPQFSPGVVVFKGINRVQGDWMKRARQFGHRVVAINEEAMALSAKPSIALETRQEILDGIDCLCAQGDNEKDAYLDHFQDVAARISITGNARLELLSPAHRHRQFEVRDAIRQAHGKFILVNTNFGYLNTEFGSPEDFLRHCVHVGVLNPGNQWEIDLYQDRFTFERENMKAFCEMVPALRQRYPDHLVVVRPHPSENHESWRRLVGKIPRVLVSGEGAPIPWILASDVLIHNTCTTGLEALLLEHPVIAYCPFSNDYEAELTPNFVTARVETMNGLAEAVDAALADPRAWAERGIAAAMSTLDRHYADAFENRATHRIFDEINAVARDAPVAELLRHGGVLDPNAPFPEQQKTRVSLTKEALLSRLKMVTGRSSYDDHLSVDQLGESLFALRLVGH
jgi:surface carbohydrate biosynthesis protein